jgi:trans-aconitate methyltransferase
LGRADNPGGAIASATPRGGPRLAELAPETVLEIGVGQNSVGTRLAGSSTNVGVEPDPTSRATAAGGLPAGARLLADVNELQEGEVFDLLCPLEVLEHLPDDRDALERWYGRWATGGHVPVPCRLNPTAATA